MHSWFECKVKYQKIDENGKEKKVSEPYLVDALSFTEAEARMNKEMQPYLGQEFSVANIRKVNYSDIFYDDRADRWYKCKVVFAVLDEGKGVEKKTVNFMLVQANNIAEALENITRGLKNMTIDYSITAINETMLMEIFEYNAELIPENLKPATQSAL